MSKPILYVYSGKARPNGIGLDLVVRQQVQALVDAGRRVVLVSRGRFVHPAVRNISFPVTPANFISFLSSKHYYNAQNRFISQIGAWVASLGDFEAVVGWTRQSRNLFRAATASNVPCFLNCPGWHYNFPLGNARWEMRPWPSFQKADLDEEFQRAARLLTASEYARSTFLANGFTEDKVINIGRAADTARYINSPRSAHPFRLAFFAQVSERKGIFEAIDAWKAAAIHDGEMWIIGAVPKELEARLKAVLPANVRLLGYRNDAQALLRECHAQILPSRQEGMAKSLVEGAACGLVTLSTREAGFPISEGETGFYIRRDDVAGTAARLRQLAAAPADRERMSRTASAFVAAHLTWPAFRQRFVAALDAGLAAGPAVASI